MARDPSDHGPIDSGYATIVAGVRPLAPTALPDQDVVGTELFGDGVEYGSIPTHIQATVPDRAPLPTASDDTPIPDDPSFRYEDLGLIGRGMMGEVRRVRDRDLNRIVAMKVVRASLTGNRRLLARFISEAQAAAQLAHPSIVPIHELGVLPDRRFFFTMKEIHGETLREIIRDLHDGEETPWTLPSVVGLFRKACDAVAYAHARGVLHRDLKPDNIMIGEFGEVLVLDWGLAKVLERQDAGLNEPVITNRSIDAGLATQVGTVAGTPCYMPPEQAGGFFDRLEPAADVYALGAILYEILVGRPPYSTSDAREILQRAMDPGATPVLGGRRLPPIPSGLAAIAAKAMEPDPQDRYPDASAFVEALGRWVEGSQDRGRAAQLVQDARRLFAEAAEARGAVEAHRHRLAAAQRAEDAAIRVEAEDALAAARRRVAALEEEAVALLKGAVAQAPDSPEAHALLADHYRKAHARAVRRHDPRAAHLEALLQRHDSGAHAGYLAGDGYATILTDPSGVEVFAEPLDRRGRCDVSGAVRRLGTTPLTACVLPAGTWMLRLRVEGIPERRVPIRVDRLGYWDGVPPGGKGPVPLRLSAVADLSEAERWIPAGWCRAVADGTTRAGLRDVWVDDLVVYRDPVGIGEFAAFLEALTEQGRGVEAARFAAPLSTSSTPLLRRDGGRWIPADPALASLPACVSFVAAEAFAAWKARVTGLPWRLPFEIEWEKAARGVDGRPFPWGDGPVPGRAATAEVVGQAVDPAAFPGDESPYGVRGCAGNVAEWCADRWTPVGPAVDPDGRIAASGPDEGAVGRVIRGGSFRDVADDAHLARRRPGREHDADPAVGFRLVRSLPGVTRP